jgi:hypothetical protein
LGIKPPKFIETIILSIEITIQRLVGSDYRSDQTDDCRTPKTNNLIPPKRHLYDLDDRHPIENAGLVP